MSVKVLFFLLLLPFVALLCLWLFGLPVFPLLFGVCIRVLQSPDMQSWQNDYLQGTGCEMYTESLSPSFAGMTFPQASE